jgi:hypothetical protein
MVADRPDRHTQEYFELSDSSIRLFSAIMARNDKRVSEFFFGPTIVAMNTNAIADANANANTNSNRTTKHNSSHPVAPESPKPHTTGPCLVCGTETFKRCWDCGVVFACSRSCGQRSTPTHIATCYPRPTMETADLLLDAVEGMSMPGDSKHAKTRQQYGFAARKPGRFHAGSSLERNLLLVYKTVNKGYEIGAAQLDQWRGEKVLGQRIGELLEWMPDKAGVNMHLAFANTSMRKIFDNI